MRVYALFGFVGILAIYAWRNWYVSLLGLILLTTVLERRDMPKAIMGIPGLNGWNLLLLSILGAWVVHRSASGVRWDVPRAFLVLLGLYFGMVFLTWLRAAFDLGSFRDGLGRSFATLAIDEVINPVKFLLPAVLFFDGARSRLRVHLAIGCLILAGFAYAVLVIRVMPLGTLFGSGDFMAYRHRVDRDTGLNAVDMATLLVGSFWTVVAAGMLWRQWWARTGLAVAAVAILVACCLCQSRGAFAAMVGVGLILGVVCYRWLLLAIPAGAVAVCLIMPSVPQRLGMGLDEVDSTGSAAVDWQTATAGRASSLWPPVVEQIAASPVIGHGRRAILRTRAYDEILANDGVVPSHPHNAYLEVLSDAGVVGLAIALAFYGYLVWQALLLARDRSDPLLQTVGAMGLATVCTLLIASLGAQSLFPKVSGMIMWVTCGLVLRASIARSRRRALMEEPATAAAHVSFAPARV